MTAEKFFRGDSTVDDIKIEDVLEATGGYGWFQKLFSFLTIFPQLTAEMIVLSPVFTGTEKVELYCTNQTNYIDDYTCGNDFNCTEPTGDEVFSSVVQEWNLVCSRSWIADTITSCQMAGMMTGAMLSSLISDTFGRNKGFLCVSVGMGVFGILTAFAINPISYAIARFLAGFGMGGCFVVYLVHLMEFLTPSWRIIAGSVSLWPIGEMILALLSYLVPNWRYLTALTGLPIFIVVFSYPFFALESPRWLLTQKRTKEAHLVLSKIAEWNSRAAPPYSTIEALQSSVLKEESQNLKGWSGIKQILKNSQLRFHLLILLWANITCSVVYYGVSFSAKALSGDSHMNMFYMGILDFLAIPTVLFISNRMGRKKSFLLYMSTSNLFLFAILIMHWGLDSVEGTYSKLITIFALLSKYGIVCSWSCLSLIIMESFPTFLRTTCLGLCALAGYLAGIAAPQSTLLGKISPSLPYVIYGFLTITTSISIWFLTEMTGKPLKDTVNSHKDNSKDNNNKI